MSNVDTGCVVVSTGTVYRISERGRGGGVTVDY